MGNREFQICITQPDKVTLKYPVMTAKKTIKAMRSMIKKGMLPIAETKSNGIIEYLYFYEMLEIYA